MTTIILSLDEPERRYTELLNQVREMEVTTADMRDPHAEIECRDEEEMRLKYTALTTTRARQKRQAEEKGQSIARVAIHRLANPETGAFRLILWNEG